MSAPNLSIMSDNGSVTYRVSFADETLEHKVTDLEHVCMCRALGIRSLDEVGHRFDEVCRYFWKQSQYVDFEEIQEKQEEKTETK